MALQIWLPLNGDLHNQGLKQNITVSNNAATVNNDGKIGKCYSFNGTSSTIYNRNISINCNKLSLCCWIYRTTSHTGEGYICALNNGAGYADCAIGLDCSTSTKVVFVAGGNSSLTTTITTNTWNHLAVTYDGNKITGYLNGNKIGTINNTTILTKTQFAIGCRCNSTNNFLYYFPGKINDVRLYDHCLTEKEVEEISKGLVLHYKLNWETLNINPNLLPDTNVSSLTKVNGPYNRYYESVSGGSYTKVWETISDPPAPGIQYGVHYKVTTASGFHGVTWYANNGLFSVTAEPYTLSCYAKKISSGNVALRFQYGKSPYVSSPTISMIDDNEWHQYSWTFTPNTATSQAAAGGTTRIYGAGPSTVGEVIVCGWKLEKGSIATQWIEKDASPVFPNTIIQDCSGYQNNGTIVGTLTAAAGSPRYNIAGYMNNKNTANRIESNKDIDFISDNNLTVSFWTKCDKTVSQVLFATSKLNFAFNTTAAYINPTTARAGFSMANFITNQWNHVVVILSGTTYSCYINGTVAASTGANNNWRHDNNRLYLLNRNYNNDYAADASISDFRIYVTTLSAGQIKELYNTSMIVNSNGTISPRELVDL